MNCNECQHYELKRMILRGPYYYAGVIPCIHCLGLNSQFENNFTKANKKPRIVCV
jgi:hypothetical protein